METKHTPGPANGHLIAAAPDMLAALESVHFAIRLGLTSELKPCAKAWEGLLTSVEAALKRAKGET